VLAGRDAEIVAQRSARKEPLTDAEVRDLLRKVGHVVIARGARATTLAARSVRIADLKGPTGNYRAPMVLRGKTLLVGFNRAALDELLTTTRMVAEEPN